MLSHFALLSLITKNFWSSHWSNEGTVQWLWEFGVMKGYFRYTCVVNIWWHPNKLCFLSTPNRSLDPFFLALILESSSNYITPEAHGLYIFSSINRWGLLQISFIWEKSFPEFEITFNILKLLYLCLLHVTHFGADEGDTMENVAMFGIGRNYG